MAIMTTRRIILAGLLASGLGGCVGTGPTPESQAQDLAGIFAALSAATTGEEQYEAVRSLKSWVKGGSAYSAVLIDPMTGEAADPAKPPPPAAPAKVTAWPDRDNRAEASEVMFQPLSPKVARELIRE